jgi:hypothetical protein
MPKGGSRKQVFDHKRVAEILAHLGFTKLGDKHSAFSTYMNPRNNVVSYYINKAHTPKGKSAYVFMHGEVKEYAYNINNFKDTYEKLINNL